LHNECCSKSTDLQNFMVATTPPVYELIPLPDPWEVARKLAHLPYLLFLDSAERHTERGRYSYVMADPVQVFDDLFETITPAVSYSTRHDDLPPFQGGLAGLIGYGLSRRLERVAEP